MGVLDEQTKMKTKEILNAVEGNVDLAVVKEEGHPSSEVLESLAKEISELSDKIGFKLVSKEEAIEHGVSEGPAMIILGKDERTVVILGIPSGHEYLPFLQTIIDVSRGDVDLSSDIKEKIKAIDFPVTIKVFVTPTCPYCPGAVRLAHAMAILNPNIKGIMVEAMEFPELSQKYNVSGVPKTVINDIVDLVGAYPPEIVVNKIMELKA